MKKFTSKKGMTVEMTEYQYQLMLTTYGERTMEIIFTQAARSLEHQALLQRYKQELKDITPEQENDARMIAEEMFYQHQILDKLADNGHEGYVERYFSGGEMPYAFQSLWNEYHAETFTEVNRSTMSIDRIIQLEPRYLETAYKILGLPTQADIQFSLRCLKPWTIKPAPDAK